MSKSIRTAALLSALALSTVSMFAREPMGGDPRPQVQTSAVTFSAVAYTVLAYFGL